MYSMHIVVIAVVGMYLREGTAVPTMEFVISNNNVAMLGGNSITLTCTVRKNDASQINVVKLEKMNPSGTAFITLANFFPPGASGGKESSLVVASDFHNRSAIILPENEAEMVVGITIDRIICSDEGEYQCYLSYLDVEYAPKDISAKTIMTVEVAALDVTGAPGMNPSKDIYENQTVTFTCMGNVGNPAGSIIWKRETETGITTLSDGITNNPQPVNCWTELSSTLSLVVTKDDNEAQIGCSIQQSHITNSVLLKTSPLNVYYEPFINGIVPPLEQTYPEGKTVLKFTCLGEGNPTPDIKWMHDNGTVIDGSKLVLANLKKEWTGSYHCVVNNSFNGMSYNASKSYFISIEKGSASTQSVKDAEGLSEDDTTIMIVVIVLVVVLVVIIVVVVVCIRRRRKATIEEPAEKPRNNRELSFHGNKPDLVTSDEKPRNMSYNNAQYTNEDALNYADLNLDDKPRSRKPVLISEMTQYAEVAMPSV